MHVPNITTTIYFKQHETISLVHEFLFSTNNDISFLIPFDLTDRCTSLIEEQCYNMKTKYSKDNPALCCKRELMEIYAERQ